jgi:hypothetical protein
MSESRKFKPSMQQMTMIRQQWRSCVFCIEEAFESLDIVREFQLRYFFCSLISKHHKMKHTKTILITALVTLSLLSLVTYSSCTKEEYNPCKNVTCRNGGTCNSGLCTCPSNYEGIYCDAAVNSKFVGVYNGTSCSGNETEYIAAGYGPNELTLRIPFQTNCGTTIYISMTGTVDDGSKYSATFPSHVVSDGCGNTYVFSALATLNQSNSGIAIHYIVAFASVTGDCYFNGVK